MEKDLGVYQLLYSLLIPRIGGNFIIKTHSTNRNYQFLSFFHVAYAKYEKIYIFQSSRNKWSPEIYIIGINFKGLSKNEENVLLNVAKELDNDIMYYPIENMNTELCYSYDYSIQKIIHSYINMKKFFIYLARNPSTYEKIKPDIIKSIDKKNKKWLKMFMKHLPGFAQQEYIKYDDNM